MANTGTTAVPDNLTGVSNGPVEHPQIRVALDAIEDMVSAQASLDAARQRRDDAIEALDLAGVRHTAIARATDMSVSNVRLIADRRRWAREH